MILLFFSSLAFNCSARRNACMPRFIRTIVIIIIIIIIIIITGVRIGVCFAEVHAAEPGSKSAQSGSGQ